jgi:plasmid stabilization system protein ParE
LRLAIRLLPTPLSSGSTRDSNNFPAFPFIGRERSSLAPGLRSIVVGNHLIFYVVEADQIIIVRVIDSRMDIDEEFRR